MPGFLHESLRPSVDPTLNRDDEFWFEDGNLIIIAQDVEFRVYMGPLTKHSPVFRDMLSIPQPINSGRAGPSDAVMHITDHPTSVRHLLRHFFAGSSLLRFIPTERPSFDATSAIIRLAHKYQLEDLMRQGITYLKTWFPCDFDDWMEASREPARFTRECSMGVVNLARITETPSLLPAALFNCCSLSPERLLEGSLREDGVQEKLSPEDLALVISARTELTKLDARAAIRIFDSYWVSAECTHQRICTRAFNEGFNYLHSGDDSADEASKSFGPSWGRSWEDFASFWQLELCPACT